MVYIFGDSIIKHVNGRNVSDCMNVKVRSHPGATTEDLINYLKPIARKTKIKKMVVIHTGINDLPNDRILSRRQKMWYKTSAELMPTKKFKSISLELLIKKIITLQERLINVTRNEKVIASQKVLFL